MTADCVIREFKFEVQQYDGQTISESGLVVWYGIHVDHNRAGGQMMGHPNILGQFVAGPDLIPVRW